MIARAHPFERLLATMTLPLGTKWRAPSNALMLVTRRVRALDTTRHFVGWGL